MYLLQPCLKFPKLHGLLLEGLLLQAVGQCQFGGQEDVSFGDLQVPFEGSVGASGLEDHKVGAVAIHLKTGGELGDGEEIPLRVGDQRQPVAGTGDFL